MDEDGFNHLRGGCGGVYGRGNSYIPLLEDPTDFLSVCNMSATIARQGVRIQLKQLDTRLALNMANVAKEAFSRTAIQESKYLIKAPRTKVRAEKKQGVVFPGHKKVMAAIERHPAMLCQNHMPRCLPCQNCTTKNPQTCYRRKGSGEPSPERCRQPTLELMPPLRSTPRAPTTNNARAQHSQLITLLAGYV